MDTRILIQKSSWNADMSEKYPIPRIPSPCDPVLLPFPYAPPDPNCASLPEVKERKLGSRSLTSTVGRTRWLWASAAGAPLQRVMGVDVTMVYDRPRQPVPRVPGERQNTEQSGRIRETRDGGRGEEPAKSHFWNLKIRLDKMGLDTSYLELPATVATRVSAEPPCRSATTCPTRI
jgi:hypothetical protein